MKNNGREEAQTWNQSDGAIDRIDELIVVRYSDLGLSLSLHVEGDEDENFWEWVMCPDPETVGFKAFLSELQSLRADELAERVLEGYGTLSGKILEDNAGEVNSEYVVAVEGLGFFHSGNIRIEFPEGQDMNSVVVQDFGMLLKIGYRPSFSRLSEEFKQSVRSQVGSLDWFHLELGDWIWRRLSNSGIVVSVVSDIPAEMRLCEVWDLLRVCPVENDEFKNSLS